MRAALYTRVSSQEQAQHGVSLAEQKERLEHWAKAEGWEIAGIYTDKGYTGGNAERPELQRMMDDARAKLFDVVVVTKLDRLFRNNRLLQNYIHELENYSIHFVAQAEGIDTSKPGMGKVILNMLGSVAEWEHDRIGERVADFWRHLARKGQWSSGRTPFGYRFENTKKELIIDPLEAEAIRFIFKVYTEKEIGIVRTAELANKQELITPRPGRRHHTTWTQSAIRYILTHPAYKGGPSENWPFKSPAIVTPEIWDAAQRQLSSNRHFRETENKSPFQGLLRCGLCGHTMRIGLNHGAIKVWECPGRLKRLHLDDSPRCTLPRFNAKEIETDLTDFIIQLFNDPDMILKFINNTLNDLEKERRILERKLKPIQGNIDRIKESMEKADTMYQLGRLSTEDYKTRISGLRSKIREFEQQSKDADPMLIKTLAENEKSTKYYQLLTEWAEYIKKRNDSKTGRLAHDREIIKRAMETGNEKLLEEISYGEPIFNPESNTLIEKLQDAAVNEKDKDSFQFMLGSELMWVPDPDYWKHPQETGSRHLRKLGLYVYVYPDKIEIKGNIRTANISPAYKQDISLPINIKLEMSELTGGGSR